MVKTRKRYRPEEKVVILRRLLGRCGPSWCPDQRSTPHMCAEDRPIFRHRGFEDFSRGQFENGGANLYVNAKGQIETIHRTGLRNNGYVDIILPNSHGYTERGPTWIYKPDPARHPSQWSRQELANDSGWTSRVVDLDGDGYADLIVVNGENGVTSELDSYVYWGGPDGLTGQRTKLPTVGAYDVATLDLTGNGLLDLIMTSAWVDHHNPGESRLLHVFEQNEPRRFVDASERHRLAGSRHRTCPNHQCCTPRCPECTPPRRPSASQRKTCTVDPHIGWVCLRTLRSSIGTNKSHSVARYLRRLCARQRSGTRRSCRLR